MNSSTPTETAVLDTDHAGPELYTALLAAQEQVTHAAPDEQMQVGGGKVKPYAGTEGIMRLSREALHRQGLILIRGRVKSYPLHHRREEQDKYGNVHDVGEAQVVAYFRLAHVSGQYLDFSVSATATLRRGMPADKAVGSAITYATRYAAIGILFIPRLERYEEPESHDDAPEESRSSRRQQGSQNQGTSTSGGAQPSRGGVDTNGNLARINKYWEMIEHLGDQAERVSLDEFKNKPWPDVMARVNPHGIKARQQLIAAIQRVEDSLAALNKWSKNDRAYVLREDLTRGDFNDLVGYATKLGNVANLVIHSNPERS